MAKSPQPIIPKEEHTLTLRRWDLSDKTSFDWLNGELPRITGMIADGYTSGEIVGPNDERGWWDLSMTEDGDF